MPTDLIDFPCSATWLRWYAALGLTADYAGPVDAREPEAIGRIFECWCGGVVVETGGARWDWPSRRPHQHIQQRQPVATPSRRPIPARDERTRREAPAEPTPLRGIEV